MPLTVDRGQLVDVAVVTFGTGCDEIGNTETNGQGSELEIAPTDWFVIPQPGQACTADIRQFRHAVQVVFNDVGPATIRFSGRSEPGGADTTLVASVDVH